MILHHLFDKGASPRIRARNFCSMSDANKRYCRGQVMRDLEWADQGLLLVENQGPSKCYVQLHLINHGKTNTLGAQQYQATCRTAN